MLRITVHDNPQVLTFQIEGRLAGPWLREVEECWKCTLAQQRKPILRVDLTGVTFIDDAGKACLAAMYCQGAEFLTADCMTKDIVAEICQGRAEQQDGFATSRSRRKSPFAPRKQRHFRGAKGDCESL
jgi:ABC-type transporter Mla MlaB component